MEGNEWRRKRKEEDRDLKCAKESKERRENKNNKMRIKQGEEIRGEGKPETQEGKQKRKELRRRGGTVWRHDRKRFIW